MPRRFRRWLPCIAATLWSFGLPAQAQAQDGGIISTTPPPGFEDLTAPQSTLVDVFHLGRPIGSLAATYQPGSISFDDPAALAAILPPLEDEAVVLDVLSGPLAPNVDLICGPYSEPDCGTLAPDVAGVIFDVGQFRVDLFINPEFLAVQRGAEYLPPPTPGLSTVQSIGAAYAGGADEPLDYNLRLFSLFAYGSGRVRAETSFSSEDGLLLDTAAAEIDRAESRYVAGLFRTTPLPIAGERRLFGVGYETSTDLRLDIERAYGSDLVVFLPRSAQVEILRDGRLLDSRLYEPGNQAIDTSGLPDGAYEVTLRIRESSGEVREEQRFFTKSADLPPVGIPRYVFDIGTFAREDEAAVPEASGTPVAHAGAGWRLTDALALGADAMVSSEQAGLELNGFYLTPLARFRVGGLAATGGDYGVSIGADGTIGNFGYGLGVRQVWSGVEEAIDETIEEDEEEIEIPEGLDLISRTATQLNLSLSYSFDDGPRIGFRALWRQDEERESFSIGPSLFWNVYDGLRGRVDFVADAAWTQDETLVQARLRFLQSEPRYAIAAEAGLARRLGGDDDAEDGAARAAGLTPTADVQGSWNDGDWLAGDLNLRAGLSAQEDVTALRVGGDYAGKRGRFGLDAEQPLAGDGAARYGGSALVSVVGSGTSFGIGGRDSYQSGVLVSVEGEGSTEFEIFVDNQPRGTIRTGQTVPLMLPNYQVYDIRLSPMESAFVDVDATPRTVSLYPGTVTRLVWEAVVVNVVYGQITWPDGMPVANARIDGALNPAYTDDLGYFQADLGRERQLRVNPADGEACTVAIEGLATDEEFAPVGTLVCR